MLDVVASFYFSILRLRLLCGSISVALFALTAVLALKLDIYNDFKNLYFSSAFLARIFQHSSPQHETFFHFFHFPEIEYTKGREGKIIRKCTHKNVWLSSKKKKEKWKNLSTAIQKHTIWAMISRSSVSTILLSPSPSARDNESNFAK
jgi:hypothetical protein